MARDQFKPSSNPGPGAYSFSGTDKNPHGGFSKLPKDFFKANAIPGPGSYDVKGPRDGP